MLRPITLVLLQEDIETWPSLVTSTVPASVPSTVHLVALIDRVPVPPPPQSFEQVFLFPRLGVTRENRPRLPLLVVTVTYCAVVAGAAGATDTAGAIGA